MIIIKENNKRSGFEFCDKSSQCLYISQYNLEINLLLSLSYKIVIIRWVFAIITLFIVIRLFYCKKLY